MSLLAIIPARGGSKRIPRKNTKHFNGLPIIAYSIKSAIESQLFEEIIVSTDDDEITEIAKQFGASVPFRRSDKNADDFASTEDVLIEVLQAYQEREKFYKVACCIYPTAPFVSADLLTEGLNLLESMNYDSVFPVVQFNYPIQRSLQFSDNGKIEMVCPEYMNSRSQDLPKRFHDTGLFYWFRAENLLKNQKIFSGNSGALVINELDCHDIDTPDDWEIAEVKYRRLQHLKKK